MTAVAGSVFTAAQFNTFVRDNLNETAPAKATTAGSIFVTNTLNQIVERVISSDFVGTSETSGSTSYTPLATPGPSVTVNTSANAIVMIYCNFSNSAGNAAWMSYEVSGATSSVANDNRAIQLSSTNGQHVGASVFHTLLTPGSNTFTSMYRVSTAGTGSWSSRRIAVIPL